ncbi:TPA: hypothetical protein JLH60_004748 [Escherichia coli]|nr:hypothetical protein [Escherichia coli]
MQYSEEFHKNFSLDPNSPTGLIKNRNGKPAGEKHRNTNHSCYHWIARIRIYNTDGTSTYYKWSIPCVLFELYNGIEPRKDQLIGYKDNNRDNLSKENLYLLPLTYNESYKAQQVAFDTYRNVILSKRNPDYYKDPKDWTDPEALEALETEKAKRAAGLSVAYRKAGRPQKWN